MVGGRSIAFRDTVRMEAPVKSLDDLGGYCLADADNYGRQVDEEMMGREESKGSNVSGQGNLDLWSWRTGQDLYAYGVISSSR